MNLTDFWTCEAMKREGRKFIRFLSFLARLANERELERLKKAFPEYWKKYEERGIILQNNDNLYS